MLELNLRFSLKVEVEITNFNFDNLEATEFLAWVVLGNSRIEFTEEMYKIYDTEICEEIKESKDSDKYDKMSDIYPRDKGQ